MSVLIRRRQEVREDAIRLLETGKGKNSFCPRASGRNAMPVGPVKISDFWKYEIINLCGVRLLS